MKEEIYDVAIIGAGVVGTAAARLLSSFSIKTVLIEKCADVSFGVSKANSGIIHAGFHHKSDTLKSKLEIKGNSMFDELYKELGFPFKRVGILVVAFSYEEMKTVENLYERGLANNIQGMEICGRERIMSLEEKLNPDVVGGLYAPTGGIIEPYRFIFALTESAVQNGVDLRCNFNVVKAESKNGIYEIVSSDGKKIKAARVVNSAGLYADEISEFFGAEKFKITPRKGEEYLLERNASGLTKHIIFPVPVKNSKGTLVIPTAGDTMMIGPTAVEVDDKEDLTTTEENLNKVFSMAMKLVPSISKKEIITSFAGLRPTLPGDDFFIDISKKASHFIQAAGIQSPGLTASPAIAEHIKNLLEKDGLVLKKKAGYKPAIPSVEIIRDQTEETVDTLLQKNPLFGNIVCRCESISEAEIINAVKKGHTTLDGVKFYTRSGMGKCQGGFCTYKIMKIIEREAGIPMEEIQKRGSGSYIVKKKLEKGFEG